MVGNIDSNTSPDPQHHSSHASGDSSGGTAASAEELQDLLLPIANVGRLMKQILPPSAKVSKGAKETMQECVSEFISFVTGEASDKCRREKRKTINGDDICRAMEALGFDEYVEPLKMYLHKYREIEEDKGSQSRAISSLGYHPSGSTSMRFNAMDRKNNS